LVELQAERVQTEQAYDQIRAALQEAESAQQQLRDLQRRIADAQAEQTRLVRELTAHNARLQSLESALADADAIERGFEAYQRAVTANEAMNAKLAESASLKERRSQLEQRISAARHEIDKTRYAAAERVRQLRSSASALDQESEWQEIRQALLRLEARASERDALQSEIQDLSTETAALQADHVRAQEDAAQLKEKIDLLSTGGEAVGKEAARCPLCGQPLADNSCAELLSTFQAQLEAERAAYKQRNAQINGNRQQIAGCQAKIAEIDRELQLRSGWQRKEAALAHVIEEARQAEQALPAARAQLEAVEAQLNEGRFAFDLRTSLAEIEHHLGELGYDAEAHRRVQGALDDLRSFEGQMQTLREARSSLDTVRLAISQLAQSQEQAAGRIDAGRAEAVQLEETVSRIPDLQRQALAARQVLESAHDREQQASLRLGAARNKVEYCADLKRQRVKRVQEERALREEQGIYQELRRAFGKNGVQAMLIEGAIPEIEEEANRLLARMSRGRMHVRFETQRDTKRGSTVETLDIHITDELGTRSYETYSGGERYRINFAIRIALSKLLSHRAGAQLQMLVIDEGFGTQDNEGRDGLIDAIHAIQDDFACILVITHIEDLKNAFNVRIEVNKTAQGSQITVV
jgi:exonuclease SbcC